MSRSEMKFDYLFYTMKTTYEPTWTLSGLSFQTQVHTYYIGLNADGTCQRGVLYGGTGAVVPDAEGIYEISGNEVRFSWSSGAVEWGQLNGRKDQLAVAGQTYKIGANKLTRAE